MPPPTKIASGGGSAGERAPAPRHRRRSASSGTPSSAGVARDHARARSGRARWRLRRLPLGGAQPFDRDRAAPGADIPQQSRRAAAPAWPASRRGPRVWSAGRHARRHRPAARPAATTGGRRAPSRHSSAIVLRSAHARSPQSCARAEAPPRAARRDARTRVSRLGPQPVAAQQAGDAARRRAVFRSATGNAAPGARCRRKLSSGRPCRLNAAHSRAPSRAGQRPG